MPADDLRLAPGPHVFVDDLEAPSLGDDDRHHLSRSLRVRTGDAITVSDGRGRWAPARFGDQIELSQPAVEVPEPTRPVSIVVALAKGTKPETVVAKATELGVDRVVLFAGDRSVPRWDQAKRERNLGRLGRVAREAGMQSRRVRLPSIEFVDDLVAASRVVDHLVRADFGGSPVGPDHQSIAVGAEGGWSEAERAAIPATVDLGPTVLRAETAAIVAAAYLIERRSSVGGLTHDRVGPPESMM